MASSFRQIFQDIDKTPVYREVGGSEFVKAMTKLPKDKAAFVTR